MSDYPNPQAALARLNDALAGDQYGWLIDVLPTPQPFECPQCGDMMQPRYGCTVYNHPPCHDYTPES